jgi:precorrin-6A/cobalt-precorrin-6A reductase
VPDSRRILVLGGTGEARRLAEALVPLPRMTVITSLAGRTTEPLRPPGELRIGGFGGAAGLAAYLGSARIDRVIDATHPYAAAISSHAVEACGLAGLPLIRLERPAWQVRAGDRWIEVDSLAAAATVLPQIGHRAFLTIGVKELIAFAGVAGVSFLVRLVDRPPEPFALSGAEIELGRGPFAEAAELELLRRHRIDVVIAKNSGGAATYGKIAAARMLGLPVLLLRRPPLPACRTVASVEAAVAWVRQDAVADRTGD